VYACTRVHTHTQTHTHTHTHLAGPLQRTPHNDQPSSCPIPPTLIFQTGMFLLNALRLHERTQQASNILQNRSTRSQSAHTLRNVFILFQHAHIHTRTCAHAHAHTRTHTHTHSNTHTHTSTHAHTHTLSHIYTQVSAARSAARSLHSTFNPARYIVGREHWMVVVAPDNLIAGEECVLMFNKRQSEALRWVLCVCVCVYVWL